MPTTRLSCSICGGPNPARRATVEEGWFQCRHCASVATVPGAGTVVTEGPSGAVAVTRPGVIELVVERRTALPLHNAFPIALLLEVLAYGLRSLFSGAGPMVTVPLFVVIYAVIGVVLVRIVQRDRCEQRIEILDNKDIVLFKKRGSRRFGEIRERLTLLRAARVTDASPPRLELKRDDDIVAAIDVTSHACLDWLFARLRDGARRTLAVDLDRELRCCGCGGPLGTKEELRRKGDINCPHCEVGLLYTHGGVHLDPVVIAMNPDIDAKSPPSPRIRRGRDGRITIPQNAGRRAVVRCVELPFVAGVMALALWPIGAMAPYLWSFPIMIGFGYFLLGAILQVCTLGVLHNFFGRRWIRVTERTFEIGRSLFGHSFQVRRFAIARLLAVAARAEKTSLELEVHCATRNEKITLDAPCPEALWAIHIALQQLRERARDLGRYANEGAPETTSASVTPVSC